MTSPGSRELLRAAVPVWIAFLGASALALPQPPSPLGLLVSAVLGAALVAVGFASARELGISPRAVVARAGNHSVAWRAVLAMLAGAVLGGTLLALLLAMSRVEPALAARLSGRADEPAWRPWVLALESSILEEVALRLCVMTAVAWAVAWLLRGRASAERVAFLIALLVSALAFGAIHLPAWAATGTLTVALAAVVLLLNGIAGLALGWFYWRWGLWLAILCHAAADVVVQGLGPRLVG